MTNVLGIDHPLVCVKDLPATRELYGRLGFRMKGIGKHPWGTSTCAIIFKNSLLELMSIYDTTLIDEFPAGDFRFGRFIHEALQEREGVSLTALYTDDAARDAALVEARGGQCQGTIEFGRDVVLADGTPDRTSTTLRIFRSDRFPRLSNFACQQHRRELIEFPEWMDHPNSAYGFAGFSVLAEARDHEAVGQWLSTIHGPENLARSDAGLDVQTGNGTIHVLDRANAATRYGVLPDVLTQPSEAYPFALDLKVRSIDALIAVARESGLQWRQVENRIVLADASALGGVILSFTEVPNGA
ncbi:VOC family protein [Rhizobium leguminosarum bv. viciae]|nr:VOC family protein [Rhizobium leguminosarum bv. viciae]